MLNFLLGRTGKRYTHLVKSLLLLCLTTNSFAADSRAWIAGTTETKAADFLRHLQTDIKQKNKKQVAKRIHYPLRVNLCQQKFLVYTPNQLIAHYPKIFIAPIQEAIQKQKAENLFYNDQGTMIGDGEVWFSPDKQQILKVIAVNETHCDVAALRIPGHFLHQQAQAILR